jgi:hypothetical protein
MSRHAKTNRLIDEAEAGLGRIALRTDDVTIHALLQRADVCRRCGYPVAIINPPTGKHCADLKCAACNAICGAPSERTASFVRSVGNKFGAPTTAILLRRGPAA